MLTLRTYYLYLDRHKSLALSVGLKFSLVVGEVRPQ